MSVCVYYLTFDIPIDGVWLCYIGLVTVACRCAVLCFAVPCDFSQNKRLYRIVLISDLIGYFRRLINVWVEILPAHVRIICWYAIASLRTEYIMACRQNTE